MTTRNGTTEGIDAMIGQNLRRYRLEAGLTQEELGAKIGVSYQQVQKYETAANRVSASRLWMVAEALNVPLIEFFLED